ncbi:MAG: peptidoglycan editing factor PgeF [Pseudomonadales bacterium]|nr:peptidoglycan editing factor PgeF [Pseudomonadales bacterium]
MTGPDGRSSGQPLEETASRSWITPDWTAQPGIRALTTTRAGGVSQGVYQGLNLAEHVGDDPASVAENRRRLISGSGCRSIQWLNQVHGVQVLRARPGLNRAIPEADGLWTDEPGIGIAVLTADCLPVVIAAQAAGVVAVAHAGWRGLIAGVLEATLAELPCTAADCVAWLGPAIGPRAYEVGDDVATAVAGLGSMAQRSLSPGCRPGKYWLDLFALARQRLLGAGVAEVFSQQICTFASPELYSYRRDGLTGRMATLAWLEPRA